MDVIANSLLDAFSIVYLAAGYISRRPGGLYRRGLQSSMSFTLVAEIRTSAR